MYTVYSLGRYVRPSEVADDDAFMRAAAAAGEREGWKIEEKKQHIGEGFLHLREGVRGCAEHAAVIAVEGLHCLETLVLHFCVHLCGCDKQGRGTDFRGHRH